MISNSSGWRPRALLKNWILFAMYACGALWLVARFRLKQRLVVLTYHRVLPRARQADSFSSPGILVTPETFEWQMQFLRRHFQPLSPDAFIALLRSGHGFPRRACLVTFDDGWHDTLEFALPALRRHQIPAVLFVPTGHVGVNGGFWQERIARLLYLHRDDQRVPPLLAGHGNLTDCVPSQFTERDRLFEVVARIKSLPLPDIEALLAALEALGGSRPDGGEDRFLDWEALRDVAASGIITVQSHAVSHRPLTRISLPEARRELDESVQTLRNEIGSSSSLHAYPNGDANDEVASAAAGAGFAAAFTTVRGHVTANSNPFLLCRVNMHETATRTRAAFLGRLLGLT